MCKNIPSEKVSNYFSLVANLLGDVLLKKFTAVWQRRTIIRILVLRCQTAIDQSIHLLD